MMKRMALLLALSLLAVCVSAVAEGSNNGGRGNGTGGGSMQTLNEGIVCRNGDGAEQDYDQALQLFPEACEAGSMKGDST